MAPGRRRDVDDAPAALLSDHRLAHRPRHQERAAEVHLHHAVPVLVRHPHEQLVARHAGVVDEDVDPSEVLFRRRHEPVASSRLAASATTPSTAPTLRFPFAHGALQAVGVASRDYHGRAVLGQPRPDLGADPAAAAGDDRDLARRGPSSARSAAPPATADSALSRPAGILDRLSARVDDDAPEQSGQDAARPDLDERRRALRGELLRRTSVHRTGLATCRKRNGRTSPPSCDAARRRSERPAPSDRDHRRRSSSAASRVPAGAMSEQWKGALTGSMTLIFPPRSVASATARSTAARWPAMTIWAGRVHVGDLDHLALRRVRAHRLDGGELDAHDGGHRAGAHGHGLLHELAALAHEAHGVGEARARRPRRARCTPPGCGRPPAPAAGRARRTPPPPPPTRSGPRAACSR